MANRKNKYDAAHLRNLARYRAQVDAIYRALTKEAAAIASGIDTEMPEDLFSFADYPKTMKRVDALIDTYKADMMKVVVNGVKSEWTLANNKNNEIARQVFGDKNGKLTPEQERRYYKNNDTAREAFLGRKERGMGLSDRVWDYSGKFKKEIEMGVDLCLRKGMPAAEMARELQKYLKHPDELYRRVRDQHGNLTLSKAAKDFHPGRGVYRSSYKNALRLAITETNMAYRLADWERWQQMDFVVGIRIQLSNNHTCMGKDGNPHPFHDICDELAGDYPKSFKWTGWHPQCRCNAVPILKTVDEKIADNVAKRNGQAPAKESVNSVKRLPKAFTDWVKDNKNRIAAAKSQPYFIRDNATAVAKIIPGVLPESMMPATPVLSIAERAQMRHDARTAEQEQAIQKAWNEKQNRDRITRKMGESVLATAKKWQDIDYTELQRMVESGQLTGMREKAQQVAQAIKAMRDQEKALSDLIPNVHDLHKQFNIEELKVSYKELNGVINKWLSKYSYSSLDAAPLEHLINKLKFELDSPTIEYSQKEIIKNAIADKIKIINQKIEWNNLVSTAKTLKDFKTKSTLFKGYLDNIDDAIQRNDFAALQNSIAEAERQQQKLLNRQIKYGGDIKSALNKEYKGGVVGKDITPSVDADKMKSEDPYRGTFTNNVARMQGFDAPAKLVSEKEFDKLATMCGDVFYRTVNPTTFNGKKMTAEEFASQLYKAEKLELNGKGGRYYGDGIYVATSAWNGKKLIPLTDKGKQTAYNESRAYGDRGNSKTLEMTWARTPKIIKESDLNDIWNKLSTKQKKAFGGTNNDYKNTYACALGYDGMYCDGPNYIVIWNRSIIAVKHK